MIPAAVFPTGALPTPWGLAAAGLAALALVLDWPVAASGRTLTAPRRRLPGWVRGRADAAPYGRRLIGGGMAGLAVTAVLLRAGPLPALAGGALVVGQHAFHGQLSGVDDLRVRSRVI